MYCSIHSEWKRIYSMLPRCSMFGLNPADQWAAQDQSIPHYEHLPFLEVAFGTHIPSILNGARLEFCRVFASNLAIRLLMHPRTGHRGC